MEKNLKSNLWKYTLLMVSNKRVYMAILGAYYLTINGVNAATIGTILLAGSLAGVILEIPSGYVSDKLGHKRAIVISRAAIALSSLFLLLANNTTLLIIGSILHGAGGAFLSGTGSAFMHETLKELKRENEYTRVMGKISSVGFAIPIVLTTLIPFLVSFSFKAPFLISLLIDLVALLIAISLASPTVSKREIEEIGATNFKQVMQEALQLNFFPYALFSGIISGSLLAFSGFRAAYQMQLGVPVILFGVLFGIGRALASLLLASSGRVRKIANVYSFYGAQLIIHSVLFIALGITTNTWIVLTVFALSNALQWGLSQIDEGYLIGIIKDSKFKATILSAGSQIDQIVGALASFALGRAIQYLSYRQGFLYLGVAFFIILSLLYVFTIRRHRGKKFTSTGGSLFSPQAGDGC